MMKESTEEMQRFRHNINNQLIVLEQSTKNRNTEEMSLLISELLEKSQEKVLYSTTGNLAIDSIVNYWTVKSLINEETSQLPHFLGEFAC